MRTLAFCDPGLDRVSVAIFRYNTGPRQLWDLASMQDKLRKMIVVRSIKTTPKEGLAQRLHGIAINVRHMLEFDHVERFYVEIPRVAGTYARHTEAGHGEGHGKFQADMQFTHYATGAIIAAAMTYRDLENVELVRALGGQKKQRLENVRMLLIAIGRRDEIRNADDLDAIALGLHTTWPR